MNRKKALRQTIMRVKMGIRYRPDEPREQDLNDMLCVAKALESEIPSGSRLFSGPSHGSPGQVVGEGKGGVQFSGEGLDPALCGSAVGGAAPADGLEGMQGAGVPEEAQSPGVLREALHALDALGGPESSEESLSGASEGAQ